METTTVNNFKTIVPRQWFIIDHRTLCFEFEENFYQKHDEFEVLEIKQRFKVVERPFPLLECTGWLVYVTQIAGPVFNLHTPPNKVITIYIGNYWAEAIYGEIAIKNHIRGIHITPNI